MLTFTHIVFISLIYFTSISASTTFIVSPDASPTAAPPCTLQSPCRLQTALSNANDGDVISAMHGNYIIRDGDLIISKQITLQAVDPSLSFFDFSNVSTNGILFYNTTASISGIVLTNFSTSQYVHSHGALILGLNISNQPLLITFPPAGLLSPCVNPLGVLFVVCNSSVRISAVSSPTVSGRLLESSLSSVRLENFQSTLYLPFAPEHGQVPGSIIHSTLSDITFVSSALQVENIAPSTSISVAAVNAHSTKVKLETSSISPTAHNIQPISFQYNGESSLELSKTSQVENAFIVSTTPGNLQLLCASSNFLRTNVQMVNGSFVISSESQFFMPPQIDPNASFPRGNAWTNVSFTISSSTLFINNASLDIVGSTLVFSAKAGSISVSNSSILSVQSSMIALNVLNPLFALDTGSRLIISQSDIEENTGTLVVATQGSNVQIGNAMIRKNQGGPIFAVHNATSLLLISETHFKKNTVDKVLLAASSSATLQLSSTTWTENAVASGSLIHASGSSLANIQASSFDFNKGGIIHASSSATAVLSTNTVANNTRKGTDLTPALSVASGSNVTIGGGSFDNNSYAEIINTQMSTLTITTVSISNNRGSFQIQIQKLLLTFFPRYSNFLD